MDPIEASRKGIEIWRPVPGYVGHYEVSNLGNVRSLDKVIRRSDGRSKTCKGTMLKASLEAYGYPRVTLGKDGVRSYFKTYELVALAFIGPKPPMQEVRHLNDDKLNARLYNLAYGTRAQNVADKVRNKKLPRGSDMPQSILYEAEVLTMRESYDLGESLTKLARRYRVSVATVQSIVNRRTWKHV